MAAHEYLKGEQLAMFIPAHALMDMITPESAGYDASNPNNTEILFNDDKSQPPRSLRNTPQTIKNKRQEARMDGLDLSIRKEGVTHPIDIGQNPHIYTHHRTGQPMSVDQFPGHNYTGSLISDGHHRIIMANDINPNMEIPVRHTR